MDIIFPKDKIAATDDQFITASSGVPISYQVDGDLGTDVITITLLGINGTDETDLYDDEGNIATLSNVHPVCSFDKPLRVRISKPVTTNDVGLMVVS